MDDSGSDNSSDDDVYVNAANKFKAFKRQRTVHKRHCINSDGSDDGEDCDDLSMDDEPLQEQEEVLQQEPVETILQQSDEKTSTNTVLIDDEKEEMLNGVIASSCNGDQESEDEIENLLNGDARGDSFNMSRNDSFILIGSPERENKKNSDNYFVTVRVFWRSKVYEKFEMEKNETFQKVFKHFAKLEEVNEDQILITKKDKILGPFDTPTSIDWDLLDILEGGVIAAEIARKGKHSAKQTGQEENTCKIKLQTKDKKTLTISMKRDQTFTYLIDACADQLKIPCSNIKIYFDGDEVEENDTPESLDIDDEACFDMKLS